ncbi:glycosyltransferase family 4 protein [Viridibacillus sp. YIM B01967]|uniref:Glycosyltransferase family 4 protein n=1 Tax=Viridibacillus soli TaxID=2798301 RepID=A0ABS1HCE4_9BACL|nr:glycosyltransferase family 4 protein [Viridibacillus soli]MBK3497122.1 glycosyltransferase family 4 protein [Viridibacillus soli]
MRVIFVATVYRHLVAFHRPYISYFQSKGYEVWAAGSGEEGRTILEKDRVKCIDISFSRSPLRTQNIEAFIQLKKLFKENSFDLVHVHTPIAALLTRVAYRKVGKGNIVYTAHGFHFFEGAPKQNWLIYYTAEKLAARWTSHLITINDEDYQNAQKLGLPSDRISCVHGVGVEIARKCETKEQKSTFKEELGLSADAIVITYVAELNHNKNHMFLFQNWKEIKKACPNAVLLIIGTGELEQDLKDHVKNEQLKDVQFLGFRRDVPRLLSVSDIVTLLSFREGLPKSIMEAMAEGLPCVVTNTRGLRDLIHNGENGFVIDSHNHKQLVKAFTSLLKSTSLCKQMGQDTKKKVKPFLLENVLPEYIAIYEKLLEK